ncbi:MAG: signal peptidase I, partial [Planctomycetaceae bacterium]
SIVIAFILAFLFRTFEAEAFVIPTGSMAPTLLGRHKDVVCDQCGYKFTVGASFEVDDFDVLKPGMRMHTAHCPNCRYQMPKDVVKDLPVFKGDRILVNKFPYELGDPQRWNVVVFKYPEHPETNYIKRLIGLPGETIEIRRGDVYRRHEDGQWKLMRKDDPNKQKELQILVYDNDHPETALHALGWPKRWAAVKRQDGNGSIAGWSKDSAGWQESPESNGFQLDADRTADGEFRWLRYRHFVPQSNDWNNAAAGKELKPPRAELITDFCGYNAATGDVGGGRPNQFDFGLYWVGDLTVNAQVEIESLSDADGSELLLELNEGGRKYRCRIDLKSGTATLFFIESGHNEEEERSPSVDGTPATAETSLKGVGKYLVTFANVDDRLCLWVNDKLVKFNVDTSYIPDELTRLPQQQDLAPVGIAARGARMKVSRLLLQRDIYYRGDYLKPDAEFANAETHYKECGGAEDDLLQLRFDPEAWAQLYSNSVRWRDNVDPRIYQFELGPDEFFMMGDNSPSSLDSRLWAKTNRPSEEHRYAVSRNALVGKAFFVYWPHGVPLLNDGRGYPINIPLLDRFSYHRDQGGNIAVDEDGPYPSFTVPFYPQVDRMRRIR